MKRGLEEEALASVENDKDYNKEAVQIYGLDRFFAYDGTDHSLIPILIFLSHSWLSPLGYVRYVIPCAVLERRPGLLESVGMYFGSNRDNFTPASGCHMGRGGSIEGYPTTLIQKYLVAT